MTAWQTKLMKAVVLLLCFSFFSRPSLGSLGQTPEKPNCNDVLAGLPFLEHAKPWLASRLPYYFSALQALNARLNPSIQFPDAALKNILVHLARGPIDQIQQLEELNEGWLTSETMPTWEPYIHRWLVDLSYQSPVYKPSDNWSEWLTSAGINPIQKQRLLMLLAEVEKVERRFGQPFLGSYGRDTVLQSLARRHDTTEQYIEFLRSLTKSLSDSIGIDSRLSEGIGINSLSQKIATAYSSLFKSPTEIPSSLLIRALSWVIKHSDAQSELDHYLGIISTEKEFRYEAKIMAVHMESWFNGDFLASFFLDSINRFVNDFLLPDYYARGRYSLELSLKKELSSMSESSRESFRSSIRNAPMPKVYYLGEMPMLANADATKPTVYKIFAIDFTIGSQVRHFTVALNSEFIDKSSHSSHSIASFDPSEWQSKNIINIREVEFAARLQDAVDTRPLNLKDPLIRLRSFTGNVDPERQFSLHILIQQLPLTILEKTAMLSDQKMAVTANTDQEQAQIRLKNLKDDVFGPPVTLNVIKSNSEFQVFEKIDQIDRFSRVRMRLVRKISSDNYQLSYIREIWTGRWTTFSKSMANYWP
jgi:hypothetical protein